MRIFCCTKRRLVTSVLSFSFYQSFSTNRHQFHNFFATVILISYRGEVMIKRRPRMSLVNFITEYWTNERCLRGGFRNVFILHLHLFTFFFMEARLHVFSIRFVAALYYFLYCLIHQRTEEHQTCNFCGNIFILKVLNPHFPAGSDGMYTLNGQFPLKVSDCPSVVKFRLEFV